MLIVLEGCDGSGKSSLAELLARLIPDTEIIHATRETPNTREWFEKIMDDAKTRNIIMDRAFWGQFVYQRPEERHMGFSDLADLEKRLEAEGGKLIYVYSPERVIKRRLNKRGEIPSLPINSLLRRYKSLCKFSRCPVIWYNSHTGVSKIFEYNKKGATR